MLVYCFWATLPVIVYFDGSQLLEHSITNAGFMIMSVVYVRSAIYKSRKDYQQLQDSKIKLEKANEGLQQKVDERTMELQQANEKRLNSFINLMHETKTPLTLINNCLEDLMVKYGENEEVEITKLSLSKLNRNMSNFFDIHKLERGIHIYDHTTYVDFNQLIQQSISVFKNWAEQMGTTIYYQPVSQKIVQADPEALYRIVDNLLENAIKYSGKNGKIEIKLLEMENAVCFSIKDNGPGIDSSSQARIFDPFYQVDHKKKNVQGIGMGLSLVKRTVESLGGTIELHGEINKGTEFKVYIPYDPKFESKDIAIVKKSQADTSYQPNKYAITDLIYESDRYSLLVIEDQKELLYRLSKQLSKQYNIYVAQNGIEAKQKLDSITSVPDLIICDVMMDVMDGFEFVESIRKKRKYQHIPIIFVTAISEEAEKLKGLKLGAVDFLVKPFRTDELKLKIESIFQLHEQQKLALIEQASKSIRRNQNMNSDVFGNSFIEKCKKYNLTDREIEILQCRMEKLSYKEIANKLFISEKTVSNHLSRITEKLGTIDRSELMMILG